MQTIMTSRHGLCKHKVNGVFTGDHEDLSAKASSEANQLRFLNLTWSWKNLGELNLHQEDLGILQLVNLR